jgi:hypothetical protein
MRSIKFKREYLGIAIAVIVFYFIIINIISDDLKKEEVLKDHKFAIGHIITYHNVRQRRRLTYQYFAEGKFYHRKMAPTVDLIECEGLNTCKDKSFVVLYSTFNPGNSLIDLRKEVDGLSEFKTAKKYSLEYFE